MNSAAHADQACAAIWDITSESYVMQTCTHCRPMCCTGVLIWEGVIRDWNFYGTEIVSKLNVVDSIPGTGNDVC